MISDSDTGDNGMTIFSGRRGSDSGVRSPISRLL